MRLDYGALYVSVIYFKQIPIGLFVQVYYIRLQEYNKKKLFLIIRGMCNYFMNIK